MVSRLAFRAALTLVLAGVCPAAGESSPDPVLAGYMRLYAGDAKGAYDDFERLRARNPHDLPAWFGLLFALQMRVDSDESLGSTFERGIQSFIDHTEQRYAHTRDDAETQFYLAQAYLLRSVYRVQYDKGLWGAARDAAKSKGYADHYIKRHPEHGDAYLALGLYNYFADIAPNFVKVLRVLLLLPSGDRVEGLKQIERAAHSGSFFAPLAQVALTDIYGWLEGRLAEAIPMAEQMVRRFPGNAGMRLALAQLYLHPTIEAYDRAEQQYAAVIDSADTSSLRHLTERYRGIQGLASLRRNQWRLPEAIALLTPAINQALAKPEWVLPDFLLRRGRYRMLLNDPSAIEDARRVASNAAMDKFHKEAAQLTSAIQSRRKTGEGAVYASLIPGNRYLADDRWDEAKAVYDRVGATVPGDWQVRYRLAYLDFAQGRYEAAARGLEPIVSTRTRIPDWLKAAALLNLGWTHDIAGRRTEALKLYKRVLDDYEDESAAGAARLGLVTPYRGRHGESQGAFGGRRGEIAGAWLRDDNFRQFGLEDEHGR